jgi:hypothetical protein
MADFARLGGSTRTAFFWNNKIIGLCRQTSIQTPQAVGPGTVPIHPLDSDRPVELITAQAASMGTIQLEMYETFGSKIWERLAAGLDLTTAGQNRQAIVDIFNAVAVYNAAGNTPLYIAKVITPRGNRGQVLREIYHGAVVSAVEDDETIEIGTMEVLKRMTLNYTHSTVTKSDNPLING